MDKKNFYLVTLVIVIIDQLVKLVVHFNMPLGSEINIIGDFFKLHHIENPGLAFGIDINFKYGKLLLTSFRLAASFFIGYYLYTLISKKANNLLILAVSMILAGAIGNVIDSLLYGVLLNNAPLNSPFSLFYGQVIDMFYVDIWEGFVPSYFPLIGGSYLSLWPVFNIADSSIFIGVLIIILFQKKFVEYL